MDAFSNAATIRTVIILQKNAQDAGMAFFKEAKWFTVVQTNVVRSRRIRVHFAMMGILKREKRETADTSSDAPTIHDVDTSNDRILQRNIQDDC